MLQQRDGKAVASGGVVSGPWAIWVAWMLAAAVNAVSMLGFGTAPPRLAQRFLCHAVDAGHFLALGLVSSALCVMWLRLGAQRKLWSWIALAVVAIGIGALVLPLDFEYAVERFAGRFGMTLVTVLLGTGIALASLCVVVAGALGRLLARPWLRWAAVVLGAALCVVHWMLLPNDYPGVHLMAALSATTLIAAGLAGAVVPERLGALAGKVCRHRELRTTAVAAGVCGVCAALVFSPPTVSARLIRWSGSVLAPYVARLHALAPMRKVAIPEEAAPWFEDRRNAAPVPPGTPLMTNPAVILLSIDAVRADLVDSGRFDAKLPVLASIRKRSVQFSQARAPGSQTVYTVTTLYSGTYFSQQYWARMDHGGRWPHEDDTRRFTESLRDAGIPTVTFAGAPWFVNQHGVVRGFSEPNFVPPGGSHYTRARALMDAALKRLSQVGDESFFLFIHFLDPHAPYNQSPVEGSEFDRYVGEVALVDGEIGRLVNQLNSSPLGKRTVLIVTSDHGEAFGEHDSQRHATTLYDELLRVPLLIRVPGGMRRQVQEPVSLIDLGPTILDIFGLPAPGHCLGQSLTPFLRGENPKVARPILAEGRLKQSLVLPDGMKVIVDNRLHTVELYDLSTDPLELDNLADDTARLERPLSLLRQFFAVHTIKREGYEVPYRR